MKKILTILFLLSVYVVSGQSPIKKLRLTQTDSVDISMVDRILVADETGVVKFISKDAVGGGGSNQFTTEQANELLSLIYDNYTASISRSPSYGERGVTTTYNLTYNITDNDDVITSASINQSIGDVTANVDAGSQTITGLTSSTNTNYQLTVNYTRNGVANSGNHSTTFSTYVPQWAGTTTLTDFDGTYAAIEAESNMTKYIQSSDNITRSMSPSNEYIMFVSTNSNATIKDGNGFTQTIGVWGDGTSEFQKKYITLSMADGTTTTAYLYRGSNLKTFSTLNYSIE